MVMKLVDIISLKLFRYYYNIITNLRSVKHDACLFHLYQGCLEEYFCQFEAPDACWTTTDNKKEAVPNYCCVCVFVNQYSTLWLSNAKRKPHWLMEFLVMLNEDFSAIHFFGHLQDVKVLRDIKLCCVTVDFANFLYFEA